MSRLYRRAVEEGLVFGMNRPAARKERPMTEAEWLASDDPRAMLRQLEGVGGASERKLRLFACACCRLAGTLAGVVDGYERAGGPALEEDGGYRPTDREWARHWTERGLNRPTLAQRASLLREIFGNPYRPVRFVDAKLGDEIRAATGWGRHESGALEVDAAQFLTPAVVALARELYDTRQFGGMPVLADALEEAGCVVPEVLMHLRGYERCPWCLDEPGVEYPPPPVGNGSRPFSCAECNRFSSPDRIPGWRKTDAPHVRGCWVLDLILGKS